MNGCPCTAAVCKEGHISNSALCHFADSDHWMDGWIDAGEDKAAKKGGLGLLALDIAARIQIKLARPRHTLYSKAATNAPCALSHPYLELEQLSFPIISPP